MKQAYKFDQYIEIDGIVYAKNKEDERFTIWLKDRPGIIGYVFKVEDGPEKIKSILDSIEGWEE